MKAISLGIVFLFWITKTVEGQENQLSQKQLIIEERLENLSELLTQETVNYDYLFDQLNYYYSHKITLDENCGTDLKDLSLLNAIQIQNLETHVKTYGAITAMEELQLIPLFDHESINRIKPFVQVYDPWLISNNSIDKRSSNLFRLRVQRTLQKSKGYLDEPTSFRGSIYSIYSKYQYSRNNKIDMGFTAEKDAGESLNYQSSQVFDFQSAYLSLKKINHVDRLIIGDYKASFGQGLTFSSTGGLGKSSEVLFIEKNANGISPYTSVNEANYMRGMTLLWHQGNFGITPFFSRVLLPANVITENGEQTVTSFYLSGLHRTENELNKSNNVTSTTSGLNIKYESQESEFGIISVQNTLTYNLNQNPALYEKHRRTNKSLTNSGFYFKHSKSNYSLFGEISKSQPGDWSMITGLVIMPDSKIGMAISIRNFGTNYQGISSGAFGEASLNQNERGIYSGLNIKLTNRTQASFYIDVFEFPWLTYAASSSSSGLDYLTEIIHQLGGGKQISIRLKWKEIEKDDEIETTIPKIILEKKSNLRIQYQMLVGEVLRLRARVEFSEYLFSTKANQGMLIFQELLFKKLEWNWSVTTRFTLFDTESYYSRIYTYEQDLLGLYSIPSFSGKGSKVFILLSYKWNKILSLGLKVSHLLCDEVNEIGSGLDEIKGPAKTEIKCQLQLKF